MAEDLKLGIYICSGCSIGETIDCDKLCAKVKEESNADVAKCDGWLCGDKAIADIKKDIKENGLERIVIGGCSPRYLMDIFQFEDMILDRANLREHVAWCHTPKEDATQDLATDYMRMSIAKVEKAGIPVPMILDINDTVMVVGGGVTGLNSAIASSKAGYNVMVVEKAEELGGFARKLYKLQPRKAPYYDLEANNTDELIAQVMADPKIKVLLSTEIDETAGQPGMFDVTCHKGKEIIKFQVGSIIQATGWVPYDASKITELKYGEFKNVITNVEMEDLARNDNILRPSDGGKVKNIVFIQCAGSRDENHLKYCSAVCCGASLKQAMYVREKYPDSNIFVVYKDMRTPAHYEKFYKRVQSEDNIFLTKGEVVGLEELESGEIAVDIDNTLVGEQISIDADMVVLATGLVPSTFVESVTAPVEKPAEGEEAKEEEAPAAIPEEPKILNLKYIQGSDLPQLEYGFPDSHYICFPYETRRTGIYAAGTVRSPMDTKSCESDALGAAMKSMQLLENIRKGTAVHPRAGDRTYPDFFFQRCTQCKRCTEECPFGALEEDIKGTPLPNPNRCRRCGICMGACPERIISFKDYSVQIVSAMIKSIYIPTEEDDGEATPRIIAFLCENDAYPTLDIVGRNKEIYSPYVRVIPVRCLGSVSTSWIADSLSAGFDGALLIGCKYGEDYQCHFIRGSELANTRMTNVQEKLKQLVLEPERVEIHTLSIDEYDRVPQIINDFAKIIEDVGPNPYKEM